MKKVIVRPLYCIKAGMWLTFHGDDIIHRDVQWKEFVQPEYQIKIPYLFYIHMEEELAGMYLGVRSSAAIDSKLSFKDLAQAFFYHSLNIHYSGLFLPSVILQAVVAYMYKVSQDLIFFRLFCSVRLQKW
jgi:hypothetical protein